MKVHQNAIEGNATEALQWIAESSLSVGDKRQLKKFVEKFRQMNFYKQIKVNEPDLPVWYRDILHVLSGFMYGYTKKFRLHFYKHNSILADHERLWYQPYRDKRFFMEFESMWVRKNKTTLHQLYMIAEAYADFKIFVINISQPNNQKVYFFDPEEIQISKNKEGEEIAILDRRCLHLAFNKYTHFLNYMAEIEVRSYDGDDVRVFQPIFD